MQIICISLQTDNYANISSLNESNVIINIVKERELCGNWPTNTCVGSTEKLDGQMTQEERKTLQRARPSLERARQSTWTWQWRCRWCARVQHWSLPCRERWDSTVPPLQLSLLALLGPHQSAMWQHQHTTEQSIGRHKINNKNTTTTSGYIGSRHMLTFCTI